MLRFRLHETCGAGVPPLTIESDPPGNGGLAHLPGNFKTTPHPPRGPLAMSDLLAPDSTTPLPAEGSEELAVLRQMGPARRIAVMHALIRQAWSLKEAAIRAAEPDLHPDEVRTRARRAVAGERA